MTPKRTHRFWLEKSVSFVKQRVPGEFVECGVKQGSTAIIISRAMGKRGYLFDTWKGFPHYSEIDAPSDSRKKRLNRRLKGKDTWKDCRRNLKRQGVFNDVDLIRGDICETVPKFIEEHPNLAISFLHIDTDLHDPAKVAFDHFGKLLPIGGGIMIHDYEDKHWAGIKIAVDNFIKEQEGRFQFFKFLSEDFHGALLLRGNEDLMDMFKDYHEQTRKSLG